nr:hypothetical protein [Amylibacter sp. SFDW26]
MIFTCAASIAQGDGAKVKWPDCYCTDKDGLRVELGTMVCMNVGGRDFIARCEMSQNVPMWREMNKGCLTSSGQSADTINPSFNT